jgi:hypothetical protein
MVYKNSVCRVDDSGCDVVMRCGKRRFDISLFAGAVPGPIYLAFAFTIKRHLLIYNNVKIFNVVIL